MATYNAYAPQNYPNGFTYPYVMQPVQPIAVQPQAQPQTQNVQSTVQIPQMGVQNNSSIVWCQGIAGAQAHPVLPGQSIMLLDSEPNSNSFYIKSADASGMPMPLRVFDYKERLNEQAQSREEVDVSSPAPTVPESYEETIKNIEERIDEIAEIQDRIIEKISGKDKKEESKEEKKEEVKRRKNYDF